MGQTGNTDFLNKTTSDVVLITDTYIDKHADRDDINNVGDSTVPMINTGDGSETAYIASIQIPERGEVLDSNDNNIPDNAILTAVDLKFYVTVAPSGTSTWYGYILANEVNIEAVTHNHIDGPSAATAWNPDFSSATSGNAIYKARAIFPENSPASTGYTPVLEMINLKDNGIDWGKKVQIIVYTAEDLTMGTASNSTAGYQPVFQLTFEKPTPESPKIAVVPDAGGINGIIKVTPSSDKTIVKHSLAWSTANTTIFSHSGHNPLDIDDIGRTEILTSEFIKAAAAFDAITVFTAAGSGAIEYAETAPLAFDSGNSIDNGGTSTGDIPYATRFQLFAEDNYNTNANGGASNIVTIARPSITLTDSATGAIDIGDENTFTLTTSKNATTGAGLGNYEGQFLSYAFYPSVDDIVYDTGVTLSGGLSSSSTDEHEIVSSDVSFEVGDVIKIDSEYMRIVGFKGVDKMIDFVRGALGSTIASHSASAPIYKVDDTKFIFTKLTKPTSLHSFTYKYPKANSAHTAVVYVKDKDGWRSDPAHIAVNVSEADPIAKLSASRTKVPYALYGNDTAGLTLSLSNSKAMGSDRELSQYLFTYNVGKGVGSSVEPQPVATCNALTNDNSCFDTGSKQVALVNCGSNENYADTTFKIFGVASFESDGTTPIADVNTPTFSHYKTVSETITVHASRLTEVVSANYYKSIDCVVGQEIDEQDREAARFVIKVANANVETNVVSDLNGAVSDVTTVTITVTNGSKYNVGDYVLCESEIMLVTGISTHDLTVIRGMFFSTAATHDDADTVNVINHNMWINRGVHICDMEGTSFTSNTGAQWKWGGFAMVRGDSTGDGIDFEADEEIELQTVNKSYSTYGSGGSPTSNYEEDWYALGFLEGDIIKVGNTTDNGTYTSPKYFKIIKIFHDDHGTAGVYDKIKVAADTGLLTNDEALYVSIALTGETDTNADIVRFDNALDPTRTVALTSYNATTNAYIGEADDFIFHGAVVDNDDGSGWLHRDTKTQIRVRGVGVRTLDLDALTSSNDIAVLAANISRSGGISAKMPLGDRRYPIGGLNTKLGNIDMSINLRILSQAGLRQIWSLIEGDRYDYFFLDSKQVDAPATVYKSYRMKLMSGTVDKAPEHASQYLASIKAVVVGEEIN